MAVGSQGVKLQGIETGQPARDVGVHYAFPDPRLFDFVAVYLEARVGREPARDLLPPDMPSIRFNVAGKWNLGSEAADRKIEDSRAILFGPTSRAQWMEGRNAIGFAVAINPLFWPALMTVKAHSLADRGTKLTDIWGDAAAQLESDLCAAPDFETRVAKINNFFLSLPITDVPDSLRQQVNLIRAALADPTCASVEQLVERTGLPQHRLTRLTKACFGFTPKLLMQRERFRRMLHRSVSMSYANWHAFIEGQYSDQSHLIRDFNRFLGMSPSRYFELERPLVEAAFREFWRLSGKTPPVD